MVFEEEATSKLSAQTELKKVDRVEARTTVKPPQKKTKPSFGPSVPNCPALLRKNDTDIWRKVQIAKNWTYPSISDDEMLYLTSGNCSLLKKRIHFPTEPLTEEERNFPLAYGIVVYTNAEQVVRMLSAFYWPQNLYCITYDLKAKLIFKQIMINLAENCFDNIVMPENYYKMQWCGVGQLHATMSCVKLLDSRTDHNWRYYQYLSGFDFPIRTNFEMVQILKVFNGSTDSFMSPISHSERDAWNTRKWRYTSKTARNSTAIPNDYITKYERMVPGNLTLLKGSMSTTFSRASANAILHDNIAMEYFRFLTDVLGQDKRFWSKMCPDEAYWTTVLFNDPTINLPQKSIGQLCINQIKERPNHNLHKAAVARYQTWEPSNKKNVVSRNCYGKYKHKSCVFGVGDLHTLITRKHFIAHKLYLNFQPATFFCLNEWLTNRTYNQPKFDVSFYEQMVDVQYMRVNQYDTEFECFVSR
uniref:Uncharacterized protein n=1 Tax=Plectus sambesii TaxID=2011161 RepID=A0A914WNE7_9BILA